MKNNRMGGGGICQEVQFGEGSLNMSSVLLCSVCGAWEMCRGCGQWLVGFAGLKCPQRAIVLFPLAGELGLGIPCHGLEA